MSVMNELKAEISRLARKEIRKELEPIKRVNAAQRGLIANLRRDVGELQKEIVRLRKVSGKAAPTRQEKGSSRSWITGKGVVSMRKRLGLTQTEFAELAGVSVPSVVKWEKTDGKIPFRQEKTIAALQEIKSMGKREARKTLDG